MPVQMGFFCSKLFLKTKPNKTKTMFLVSLKQFVSSMAGKKFQVWPTRVLGDWHCHLSKGPNSCSNSSLSHPVSSKLFAAGLLGECSRQPKTQWSYLCSYWVKKERKHCVWKEMFLLRHWFFFFFFILLKKKAASSWTEIFYILCSVAQPKKSIISTVLLLTFLFHSK